MDLIERLVVIGAGIISTVSLFYSWITWRSRANAKKIKSLEGRIENLEGDVMDRLEDHSKQLSERERKNLAGMRKEVGEVHDRITGMGKTVSEIKGQTSNMAKTLNMINQHLLQAGGDK